MRRAGIGALDGGLTALAAVLAAALAPAKQPRAGALERAQRNRLSSASDAGPLIRRRRSQPVDPGPVRCCSVPVPRLAALPVRQLLWHSAASGADHLPRAGHGESCVLSDPQVGVLRRVWTYPALDVESDTCRCLLPVMLFFFVFVVFGGPVLMLAYLFRMRCNKGVRTPSGSMTLSAVPVLVLSGVFLPRLLLPLGTCVLAAAAAHPHRQLCSAEHLRVGDAGQHRHPRLPPAHGSRTKQRRTTRCTLSASCASFSSPPCRRRTLQWLAAARWLKDRRRDNVDAF